MEGHATDEGSDRVTGIAELATAIKRDRSIGVSGHAQLTQNASRVKNETHQKAVS
jgi:hypothetical protein